MDALNDTSKQDLRFCLQARDAAINYLRQWGEIAEKANEHEDSMLVWCVALAGGGILFVVKDAAAFGIHSRNQMLVAVGPWLVTVLLGVFGRLVMGRLRVLNRSEILNKLTRLAMMPFLEPVEVETDLKAIGDVMGGVPKEMRELNALVWWGGVARNAAIASLGIGIITAIAVWRPGELPLSPGIANAPTQRSVDAEQAPPPP